MNPSNPETDPTLPRTNPGDYLVNAPVSSPSEPVVLPVASAITTAAAAGNSKLFIPSTSIPCFTPVCPLSIPASVPEILASVPENPVPETPILENTPGTPFSPTPSQVPLTAATVPPISISVLASVPVETVLVPPLVAPFNSNPSQFKFCPC